MRCRCCCLRYILALLSVLLGLSWGFLHPTSTSISLLQRNNDDRQHLAGSSASLSSSASRLNATSSDDEETKKGAAVTTTTTKTFAVQVSYKNQSTTVHVRENETILAALERHQISNVLSSLPHHTVPSDCRRGNCLTCTGTHTATSNLDSVVTEDGLSPHMSGWMRDKGFLLTCSSQVIGEGLEVRLGEHSRAWKEMYKDRFENDQTRFLGWTAMARTKRENDERHVPRWTQETEGVLKEGPDSTKQ